MAYSKIVLTLNKNEFYLDVRGISYVHALNKAKYLTTFFPQYNFRKMGNELCWMIRDKGAWINYISIRII